MKKLSSLILIFALSLSTVSAAYKEWFVPTIHMPFRPADNYKTVQNPPGFTWPYIENATYDLIVCSDRELKDIEYQATNIKENMYVFPVFFESGREYYWAVKFRYEDGYESKWSDSRCFYIEGNSKNFSLNIPTDYSVFNNHPVFFSEESINNTDTTSEAFYSLYLSVEENIKKDLPKVNINDSQDKKILYYQWAENVAEAALIYRITGKERYREFALKSFENLFSIRFEGLMDWNQYTDTTETRFSYNAAIAFDLLYNELTVEQKESAIELIEAALKRPYENFQKSGELNESMYEWPYSSHKYGMHMTMAAALIISGESDYAKEIVEFHLPFYAAYRDFCGIEDGSSYEGVFYALSPTDDEIADFLAKYGIAENQAYNRNKAYDILYLWPDNWINMIGDGYRTKGGMCNAYLLKTFYYANNSKTDALKSVNKWIFNKESNAETYYSEKSLASVLYNDWKNVEAVAPKAFPSAKLFPDTGRAAMYSDLTDENRVGLIFVSSPYGSDGHAHPDQNSFIIQGYGQPLAVDSGFYEYYHSDFDIAWSRNSIAHNVITVDGGKGQPYGTIFAKGKITSFLNHSAFDSVSGDAKDAYFETDSQDKRIYMLNQADREIIFLRPDTFITVDSLDSDSKRNYEWWLNAYGDITFTDNTALVNNNGAKLYTDVLYPEVSSVHYNGFVDAEGNPLVNSKGEVIKTPEGANEFNDNRICFKTEAVNKTKIVTLMQAYCDSKKSANHELYNEYVKITTDGYTVYVNLTDNLEITADGYTFDGSSLVIKNNSLMMNNGKILKYNNNLLVSSDNEVSVAYDNEEISISALNDKTTVYINQEITSGYLVKDESIYPMSEFGKFGISYNDGKFVIFPGEYHIYINGKLPEGHYTVTNKITGNGRIESSAEETVLYRDSIEYKIFPDAGHYIKEIKYNGENVEVNSSNIFRTPPIEEDVTFEISFAKMDGMEEPIVKTFEKAFNENGCTTVTVGEIINKGLAVSEYGIIAGKSENNFKLSDVDGKNYYKIPARAIGKSGYYGVKINDPGAVLDKNYFTRTYAIINNKEYYGDVIYAMKNGGYDENKDTSLRKVTVAGEEISFSGNTYFLGKCIKTSDTCNVTLNSEKATYSANRENYITSDGKTGTVFKINVISADNTKSEIYTIYCSDGSFLMPMADSDLRAEQWFAGDYGLIYTTKNDINAILGFDISEVAEFSSATLRLTELQSKLSENTLKIYEAESVVWDENNISYFNSPAKGKLISNYITDSSTQYETLEIDITEYLKKLKGEGKKVLNIMIAGETLSMFCSKESSNSSYKPLIILK